VTKTEVDLNTKINDIARSVGLTTRYDIRDHYKSGLYGKKTLVSTLNDVYKDMFIYIPVDKLQQALEQFNILTFKLINDVYNKYGFGHDKYMSFMPTSDIYEIINNENIRKVKRELLDNPNPVNVKKVYQETKRVINEEIREDNQVRIGYLTESFNTKQGDQCLALRGFGNDIAGDIFSTIIPESYAEGYTDLISEAIDSRGAVTALFYSSQSIRDAESFAKATQIISEYVQKLKYTDCGSKVGIQRFVRPPGKTEHGDYYDGDIQHLLGQMYKINIEDEWKTITRDDTHLFGKTIYVRTALSCTLKDNKEVCSACFGKHGYAKHKAFNLGQWSCTKVNEPAVQSLLSAKHFIVSADGGIYVLSRDLSKYIKVSDINLSFTRFYKKYKRVTLSVKVRESYGFKDITTERDVMRVSPERISNVKTVVIKLEDSKGKIEELELKIGAGNKSGAFTSEFLKHMVTYGKTMNGDSYEVDITNWNYKTPFLFIPNHVFNYNQLVKNLESLMGSGKSINGGKIESLERILNETFDLYNTKLSLHISHLATVIYGLASKDPSKTNYMMSRGLDAKVGTIRTITKYRGFTSMASTGTLQNMFTIHNIESEMKEPHNLDVLIDPQGFLDNYD
jgi:hypothetical protein